MQVDNETFKTFLQINLRPDEREQLNRLLEEPMEYPTGPPTTNYDPRDGPCLSASEPILPPFGPGDVEVTLETSIGPEVPAKEIVDNKTVRVDGVELPPKTPGVQIICQGCTTVGHTTDSCPLTSCQQYKLKGWMKEGTDRLSASFKDLAKNPPVLPAEPAPPSTLQTPASDNLDDETGPLTPAPAVQRTGEKTAPTLSQETSPLSTEQQTSNNAGTLAADRLLSSIGARAEERAEETTQPGIGATPP